MRAWLFQDSRQKQKLGDKCPWSVGYYDPDGKKRSKRIGSKSLAEKFARKIEGQLAAGTYQGKAVKPWKEFRTEYERRILPGLAPATREAIGQALDAFELAVSPARVAAVKTSTIDTFIGSRQQDEGRRPGSKVSPATINKELRHLKAVLRVANEWGYLPTVPKIRMLREPKRQPRYVTPEDFGSIHEGCDVAALPAGLPYPAADWWRGLLTFAYMTGWRISECLALRRSDIDLDAGVALTRADDNKGSRDENVPLHPIAADALRKLQHFGPLLFPWDRDRRTLYSEFHRIQKAAGINLECRDAGDGHECTDACHLYGFHTFRSAFATMNAESLPGHVLQKLMRHVSYTTTQRYINMAKHVKTAVNTLYVPPVLTKKNA